MSKILDMRKKRGEIWDQAKAFLDAHQDENGVMSAEDTQTYERMEQEVVDLGHAIDRLERAEQMDRELNSDPANPMLTGQPERPLPAADTKRGTASDAYMNRDQKGNTSGFASVVGKDGGDFKRQFTAESYRQFFLDAGYQDIQVTLAEGRIPCAVAVVTKK